MNKRKLAIAVAGVVLTATSVTALVGWHAEHREVLELRHQIAKSRQNEKRSDVVRSIR